MILTVAERTGYRETSRHADVLAFIKDLRAHRPGMRVESMGLSALGQEMPVLVLGQGNPVILVIANIHAGEVEGKEALLMLARDLPERVLEKLTLLFIPNYNPDGNDRIDVRNRALDLAKLQGQIGPEGGVGTRYTGAGINLNRDYMKLEAVESRNLSALVGRWKPHLTIDCHTTDGSIHGFALTYDTSHISTAPCEYVRTRMLPEVSRRLDRRTGLKTFFYGNFVDERDLSKGWATYPHLPRYGSHYRGLTGRMDILLESYSYIPFRERVAVTTGILREIFDYAIEHSADILRLCREGEAARPDPVAIAYGPPGPIGTCDILAWDMESQLARRIPGREPQSYPIPHLAGFKPIRTVIRPEGYVLPKRLTAIREKLLQHNIGMQELASPRDAQSYVIESLGRAPSPDAGDGTREETVVTARVQPGVSRTGPGDLFVPADQPLGTIACYLLEPESDDGLVRWGLFDDSLKPGAPYPVQRLR